MISHKSYANYNISFLPAALKDLDKIDRKTAATILEKIDALITEQQNLDIKKLKSKNYLYRLRIGNFRVIYRIIDNKITILIVAIGHRKEIYQKALKRV